MSPSEGYVIWLATVKEEIFVGKKFRTFPSKTFRMEFFCTLKLTKKVKPRRDDRKGCKPGGRKFGMEIKYIFQVYESYKIKFPTKIPSFTVFYNCYCMGMTQRFLGNELPGNTSFVNKMIIAPLGRRP